MTCNMARPSTTTKVGERSTSWTCAREKIVMKKLKEKTPGNSRTIPFQIVPKSNRSRISTLEAEPDKRIDLEIDTGTYADLGRSTVKLGKAGFSLRNLKMLRSLRNPVYRLYYGALLGNMASMNIQMVARSLLAYRLAGSATVLGIMALATSIPMLCLSLFGGVIADRVPKKYVLIAGQASSAAVALGVALTLTFGYLSAERLGSWWILVLASLLQGVVLGLMMPSRQALVAEIVGEEQLMNAVALNVFGMNTLRIMAPALAGFAIDTFGFESIYYAMTGLYLMAVIFATCMPLTGTRVIPKNGVVADLKSGLQYVRHETTILLVLIFALFAVVLSMPYLFLMPIFVDDILKVGARGMGVLISVSGLGAIAGSIILATLPNKRRGALLLLSGIVVGLALTGFSFSTSWYLSLFLITFVGLGQAGRMTLANTLLQYYVATDYRGRVMSLYMMEFGLMSLGVFFASILAESMGIQWSVGGFALSFAFLSLLTLTFVPRIRNLD